jgi:NAD-dependent SIR2 family protein deacetylase
MSAVFSSPTSVTAQTLVNFIETHPRLFVLTGAGCSTGSGIPDYRDDNGDWKLRQPVQYQDFVKSEHARKRYWARSMVGWPNFARAAPNPAHHALAVMERRGLVHQLVTQNVDTLHQRAGSRRVIDLHGRLDQVECLNCRKQYLRADIQQELNERNPGFSSISAASAPDGDAHLENIDFAGFHIPVCIRCRGILKPSVVFFGEQVPKVRVELALKKLEEAKALLVVGSSLMVFSGYRFCKAAVAQGKPIAAINFGRTRADDELTLKIGGDCGEVLQQLIGEYRLAELPDQQ